MSSAYSLAAIGHIKTPFQEKFGIPRQSGLVDVAGVIEMLPGFDKPVMFEGLDAFSHIWVSFVFHQCLEQGWKERVRPPRLGGNQAMGVFATRSPFRPNHLGLSVVRLDRIETRAGRVRLHVLGADLLDGTPVVDIKPYLPYVDKVSDATGGFAPHPPETQLQVVFSERAEEQLLKLMPEQQLRTLIEQLVALDPRPAYRKGAEEDRVYGMRLAGCNVRWRVADAQAIVLGIEADDPAQ
ncbi:tRNA (N6-threonylcarbamoyladenosine(37)-N6)-methyltransferase TrmO [Thiolapillus sp.]